MKFLTVSEYAKLKKVTRQAVHQKIKRGKLKLVKVSEEVKRIPVEDIELPSVNV